MEKNNGKDLKYSKLIEILKKMILEGKIDAGDKLPSENELSKEYQVSRHTVRKALAILENEGYVYAVHGKGTFCSELVRHTKTSKNIAVITTYLSDYIFPSVIQGIDSVLTQNGYSILLKNTGNSRQAEARCLEELLQKDIEGLIIEPSKSEIFCRHTALYEKMDQYNIPYVFIQGCFDQMREKPWVLMNDYQGGYLVTNYLISLGHRDILGVFKADDLQGKERHRGYVRALQEAGILYNPENVIWFHTEDRTFKPFLQIQELLKRGQNFTAVACYNDQIALEVIRALGKCGKSVPEDISVTGYDNSFMAENYKIGLTTIAHPQKQLGEISAQLLLDLIQNPNKKENTHILIEPKLVIRESCREI